MGDDVGPEFSLGFVLAMGMFIVSFMGGSWLYVKYDESTHPTMKVAQVADKPHAWSKIDSRAYAHDQLLADAGSQFACLDRLWAKESTWNPKAINPVRSMGLHAGGIPQLLGLSVKSSPPSQIDRGLGYIRFRYATPCRAWAHWLRVGWY